MGGRTRFPSGSNSATRAKLGRYANTELVWKSMRVVAFVTALLLSLPAWAGDETSQTPEVRSESAVVLDARTGAEVWAKDADAVRPIASISKIFVAMAVRRKGIALDDWTEITQADV